VKKLCSADDCTLKRAPSVQPLLATGTYTLKRTSPVAAPFVLCSGRSGADPSFAKCFFQLA